jgi:Zn ribbon nucleic-acid-binding protein
MWREHNKQFIDCIHCDFSKTIDNATDQQATTKLIGIKTLDID